MDKQHLRWNGWGLLDAPDVLGGNAEGIWAWLGDHFNLGTLPKTPAVPLAQLSLPESRLSAEHLKALAAVMSKERVSTDARERAYHARGRSYHDLLYLRAGRLETAPDAVVYPANAGEAQALVEYAVANAVALIPYGGGSSVVGGVTPLLAAGQCAAVTVDMALMNRVLEINKTDMVAHIEAGIYGPALEKQLQAAGVTLGHYPQSFEYSTLGGWIASRGAGHQSNKYGKAEDWFVAANLATPKGAWRTETFPKSAAGPLLRDLVPGSEGVFGIITDAWARIHELPKKKEYRAFFFQDFESGVNAARTLLQQGVSTAMVRLSDANETFFYSVMHGGAEVAENGPIGFCLMLIGFEGNPEHVTRNSERACDILGEHGGADMGAGLGETWLQTRFETPYLRDPMLDRGLGVDTLETAVNWERLPQLHADVCDVLEKAIATNTPPPATRSIVMAHLSHSYRDGASLYFTFVFPRDLNNEVTQWLNIKKAASDAIIAGGGTISHHHGVGTDHRPWMTQEKGATACSLLRAIKTQVDPANVLNPNKMLP
ncbi:MAG TPA: FAD-binding oxidoreductase [Candidatus Hydrogenedentes bacterium]|nr:FAD-binding oxidoreductase [Candidatus Hydrogenedentota bacterium]